MNVSPANNNQYNSPKQQCVRFVPSDGSTYYIRVELPRKNANTRKASRNKLFDVLPIYTQETFPSAPDGIYTWILSDKGFAAVKVLSMLEHATIHASIADRVKASKIHIAGEAKKEGSALSFNLLSGTYTYVILRTSSGDKTSMEEAMAKEMTGFFSSIGLEVVGVDKKTYITQLPTEDELRMYAAAGYDIKLYKTKDACGGLKRIGLQTQLDNLKIQMSRPMFSSPVFQERFGATKKQLEEEIAALNANKPIYLGGKRRKTRRRKQK